MDVLTVPAFLRAASTAAKPATIKRGALLALDLGTSTGWALQNCVEHIASGTVSFQLSRFDGGGMRYLRFLRWIEEIDNLAGPLEAVYYEEVPRHIGTDAGHVYGGFQSMLTAWCEEHLVAYQGVPVGTIKRFATGKGNAGKPEVMAAMADRGFNPKDDNEADAIALLLWAIETRGGVR